MTAEALETGHAGATESARRYDALHELCAAIGRARAVVAAAGASTAALYLDAASGNVRHALAHWARTRPPADKEETDRAVGRSTLRLRTGLPIEARSCRHAVDVRVDAVCVYADRSLERCVWVRRVGDDGVLGCRGRVVERGGELWFEDDPGLEACAASNASPSLAADLLRTGALAELATGPVGAALLVQALADGSWYHLGSLSRWFMDAGRARALVDAAAGRAAGRPTRGRLAGTLDRTVLARIEALGWRHVPTPPIPGT